MQNLARDISNRNLGKARTIYPEVTGWQGTSHTFVMQAVERKSFTRMEEEMDPDLGYALLQRP